MNNFVLDTESRRYSRQFTVAKIPSLLTLDGSIVSKLFVAFWHIDVYGLWVDLTKGKVRL